MSKFVSELQALLQRHNLHLQGSIRVVSLNDSRWDAETATLQWQDTRKLPEGIDRTGPFLDASIDELPQKPQDCNLGFRGYVRGDYQGYQSPVDGRWIDGKREHHEALKRNGCRILEKGESERSMKSREAAYEQSVKDTASKMVESAVAKLGF